MATSTELETQLAPPSGVKGTDPQHPEEPSRTSLSGDESGRSVATKELVSAPESSQPQPRQNGMDPEPEVEQTHLVDPALEKQETENYKPKTIKFWLIILSATLAMFLVALDRTIISTAIPYITDEFHSVGDIGWYGSAYMLTTASFMLVCGRLYRFYDLKWVFIMFILVFEVGSAVCGAAPSSLAFIIGRAIAGLGASGIQTGAMLIIIPMVPLHKRPIFQSMFGMVFGVSSVTGPLIGGAYTQTVSWRWCFYMNLPIGGAAVACILLFLKLPAKPQQAKVKFWEQVLRLDPLGSLFFLPSIICLILALQWGGSTYAWSNWRIIVLFVIFAIAILAFAVVQVLMPKTASLPVRVITQRSALAGAIYMVCLAGAMMILVYYIPLWFQTTHGVSPVKSGINTIPLVLSLTVASFMGNGLTQYLGYYVPSMIVCTCIMSVGEGLLTTFTPTTGSPYWIGYQFLCGFGLGFGMMTASLAAQTVLPPNDIPTGVALMFFSQQLGGSIFVSVGQNLLSQTLESRLSNIPGLNTQDILKAGATELRTIVPAKYLGLVLSTYNYACTRIFYTAMGLTIAALLPALCMEWKDIRKNKKGAPAGGPVETETAAPEK